MGKYISFKWWYTDCWRICSTVCSFSTCPRKLSQQTFKVEHALRRLVSALLSDRLNTQWNWPLDKSDVFNILWPKVKDQRTHHTMARTLDWLISMTDFPPRLAGFFQPWLHLRCVLGVFLFLWHFYLFCFFLAVLSSSVSVMHLTWSSVYVDVFVLLFRPTRKRNP